MLLDRLDRLCRLAAEIAALRGENDTLRRIVQSAVPVVGVPQAHIALVDRDIKVLYGVISSGRHPAGAPRARFTLHRGLAAVRAITTRRPVVVRNAARDRRVNAEARARLGIGSVAYVPLLGGGESFGLLILTTPRPHAWSTTEVRLATYVASVASVAIQTSRLLKRLARAEERLRHRLPDVPALVYTCEADWPYRTYYVSPEAEGLLGYPAGAWIEDPDLFFKLVHPEDVERIEADAEEARRGSGFARSEYRMLDRDGNVRWFRDDALLVRDPSGRPVAWHGVLVETSSVRRTAADIRDDVLVGTDGPVRHRPRPA